MHLHAKRTGCSFSPTPRLPSTKREGVAGGVTAQLPVSVAGGQAYRLEVGARTDIGRQRRRNEDALHAEPPDSARALSAGWLGIVADGLGGRPAGDVASELAVRTIVDAFYGEPSGDAAEWLRQAVEQGNAAIHQQGLAVSAYAGMACTVTAAIILGHRLIVAQVGDSRAYLLRDRTLARLTRDHSLVEELVRAHELTPEQARTHARRNIVTRALGTEPAVAVDLVELQPHPGDVLLVCSDGLHGHVGDDEIAHCLDAQPSQPAADALVALANAHGGRDNTSVVVARLVADAPAETPDRAGGLLRGLAAVRRYLSMMR
jgi:serine/threonine protein phosphatase PrpC